MANQSAYSFSLEDWKSFLLNHDESIHLAPVLMDHVFKRNNHLENQISKKLKSKLEQEIDFALPSISHQSESNDGTYKFLIKFSDSFEVESVLIPFYKRYTVCLSTQVGCAMNCSFCFTGTQGLKRNLKASEIIGQYIVVNDWLKKRFPNAISPSIVFMGQGEPLHNIEELSKAIQLFTDSKGLGIGHRQITLSTVGYLPQIHKLIDLPRINIALSLHSPFEEERIKLIPISSKYPLSDVLNSLDSIPLLPRQFITIEYILIKNLNMSESHASKLFELLQNRKVIINLIPFNPFPGSSWERPDDSQIETFKNHLVKNKLRVMIRKTKGSDILAACGQLKVKPLERENATK